MDELGLGVGLVVHRVCGGKPLLWHMWCKI